MALFGCLICKEEFSVSNCEEEQTYGSKGCAVFTSCGHYFHVLCLEKALVRERETNNCQNRKSCPTCRKPLHKALTKINLPQISNDNSTSGNLGQDSSSFGIDEQKCFATGDRVTYTTLESEYLQSGSVARVLIDIEPDTLDVFAKHKKHNASLRLRLDNTPQVHALKVSNPAPFTVCIPIEKVKHIQSQFHKQGPPARTTTIPLFSSDSGNFSPKTISDSESQCSDSRPRSAKISAGFTETGTKWIAGDRIFLTEENEYARIKWIGSRNFTFMVVIQYEKQMLDDTSNDVSFELDDLPFKITQENGQKYRRLTLEELDNSAQKASNSPIHGLRTKITKFRKWGSLRLSTARKSWSFGDGFVVNGSSSRPVSATSTLNNLMMDMAELKITQTGSLRMSRSYAFNV